jgi:tripartite ATP-independent transporter DctM subunit
VIDPTIIGIIGIVLLLVLLIIGVHIAVALMVVAGAGVFAILGFRGGLEVLLSTLFYKVFFIQLVVLPLFILAGLLASHGKLSDDAYNALGLWLGRVKGGLGIATMGGCTFFGTVCGSSLVTASVFAKVAAPHMRRYGYEKKLAYGICCSAGNIGMLIPPSTLIVFYAVLTQESPGRLLIAGIVPGLALFVLLSLGVVIIASLKPNSIRSGTEVATGSGIITWREKIKSLKLLWPFAVVFLILVGGIFSGFFNVTEAASFTILALLIIILATGRSLKGIGKVLADAGAVTAMIFFIIIAAGLFSRFLALTGIGPKMIEWIITLQLSQLGIVIAMCVVYILLGCFLDSSAMLSLTIPVIYPVVKKMGIDPIWFGMSVLVAIHAGTITPPVGLNAYSVKGVAEADVSLEDIFSGVTPFFFLTLLADAFVVAFPRVITFLPNLMIKG